MNFCTMSDQNTIYYCVVFDLFVQQNEHLRRSQLRRCCGEIICRSQASPYGKVHCRQRNYPTSWMKFVLSRRLCQFGTVPWREYKVMLLTTRNYAPTIPLKWDYDTPFSYGLSLLWVVPSSIGYPSNECALRDE